MIRANEVTVRPKGIAIDYLRNALSKYVEKCGHILARGYPNFLAREYYPSDVRNLGYGILTFSVNLLYQRINGELHPETLRPTYVVRHYN